MWKDPIVEEVRKVRQKHAAAFNNNIDAILADLREQEKQSGRNLVSLKPKKPRARPKRA